MRANTLNHTESDDEFRVLSTAEYFPAVLKDIEAAQKYIFVKIPTWRNDETGREFAKALWDAAERGVKVLIINDRQGDFFEYAEGNGQAFFHDNPSPYRLLQAQLMAHLYDHEPARPRKNNVRAALVNHPNIEVIDDLAIHDHSKVIIIDGQIAFVGGANAGNDFHASHGSDEARMVDYMSRIQGEAAIKPLLQACLGEKDHHDIQKRTGDGLRFVHNHIIEERPEGFLDFVNNAQGALTVAMAFHTKPEYIDGITELIRNKQPVTLMTPVNPTTRRYGNMVFLKNLVSATVGFHDFLTVAQHPARVHAKVAYDDHSAWIGSENWTMAGHVAETSVLATGKQARDALERYLALELSRCKLSTGKSLNQLAALTPADRLRAGMEDLCVGINTRLAFAGAAHIAAARSECHRAIRELLAPVP